MQRRGTMCGFVLFQEGVLGPGQGSSCSGLRPGYGEPVCLRKQQRLDLGCRWTAARCGTGQRKDCRVGCAVILRTGGMDQSGMIRDEGSGGCSKRELKK